MSNAGVLTTIQGLKYNQFGKSVLSTQIQFSVLEAIFEIDHKVQRELDSVRRAEIREFILNCIRNQESFYFSPFIFSSRGNIKEVGEGFELEPGSKIYVMDGQHRRAALSSAINYLKTKKEAAEEIGNFTEVDNVTGQIRQLSTYPVSMQIYLDLDQEEERQLFTDVNTERKEAHRGLLMQYDQRDKYTELTREVVETLTEKMEIEFELSRLTAQNSAITSLATMRRCLIALFEGLITAKTGEPYYRNCRPVEVPGIAKAFFESWIRLFPRNMADRKKYVTGLTGIQIALAKTVYALTRESPITHKEAIGLLSLLKKRCTWRHEDPIFKHMYNPLTRQLTSHSTTTAINKTVLAFLLVINQERSGVVDYS